MIRAAKLAILKSTLNVVAVAFLLNACSTDTVDEESVGELTAIETLRNRLARPSDDDVLVVAHRACWIDGAPENSLAAISECIAMGVDMIEIDVRLTVDGVPVLLHDETLDRTTNGSGSIRETSYETTQALNLKRGSGVDAPLTDEKVPTLREALILAKGRILINLDVKLDIFGDAFAVVEEIGVEDQIVMKMGVAPDDPILSDAAFVGKTMFMPIIRECTARHIERKTHCVPSIGDELADFEVYEPIAYEITYSTPEFLIVGAPKMEAMGGRVWVNTLSPSHAAGHTDAVAANDPDAHWGQVVRDGANIIQTDRPRELIAFLSDQGLR